ncbi:hypothetical protein F9282_06105 [Proteus terrae subsp. cibarius]|uniref:Phage protein n=1 Tax=Proteus terrae subsp. cibarius TaxID=626774 RepID=A0ABX6JMJ9_9GAMM|nr:hypothetical protein [Proteus terrae]QGW02580.1 hypothetical protein F9282_06105 [Proteus terrae subsp. cibarius]QIF90409.1 hypothetical protein GTH23_10325 [Proteus terrae subsp. cibarius]
MNPYHELDAIEERRQEETSWIDAKDAELSNVAFSVVDGLPKDITSQWSDSVFDMTIDSLYKELKNYQERRRIS